MENEINFQSYKEFATKDSAYELTFLPGIYLIKLIGASGGYTTAFQVNNPGKGGLVQGIIKIRKTQKLYLNVGSQGTNSSEGTAGQGGYNGGGSGGEDETEFNCGAAGGGGATDIRLSPSFDAYTDSLIVAGGGGGRSNSYDGYYDGTPGCGGGLIGGNSQYGKGGLQDKAPSVSGEMESGKFGEGGSAPQGTSGGGGGGWFGGSTGKGSTASGGAGGSGYVLNISSHKPSAYKLNDPQYFLMSSKTFDGKSYFPKCEGSIKTDSIENGHSGHGCVRITILSQTAFCTIKKINPLFNQFVKISSYLLIINMNSS